jgi:hypothetical protein
MFRIRASHVVGSCLAALLVPLMTGCPAIIDVLNPRQNTVRLVNNGTFPVIVEVRFNGDPHALEAVLRETGRSRTFTLPANGGVASFSQPCDDLQSVMVADADLQVIGQIGPETSSEVFREGDEFDCRDTIVFTFTNSALIVDFRVITTVE